jgi:hypothetical protein
VGLASSRTLRGEVCCAPWRFDVPSRSGIREPTVTIVCVLRAMRSTRHYRSRKEAGNSAEAYCPFAAEISAVHYSAFLVGVIARIRWHDRCGRQRVFINRQRAAMAGVRHFAPWIARDQNA